MTLAELFEACTDESAIRDGLRAYARYVEKSKEFTPEQKKVIIVEIVAQMFMAGG